MDCILKQVVFLFARETCLPIKLKLDSFEKVQFGYLCIKTLLPSSTLLYYKKQHSYYSDLCNFLVIFNLH